MGYINMRRLVALLSTGLVLISLSGCQKNESLESEVTVPFSNSSPSLPEEPSVKNEVKENSTVSEQKKQTTTNSETIDNEEVTDKSEKEIEEEVVKYFEDLEKEVAYYVNEENFDKVKDKAKEIAIIGIDFIFYGTEIKGVTFEELTQESKEKIMGIVSSIDSKLESKIPGYKETIKDKFGRGYDYLSEKIESGKTYVDGKLSDKYGEDYEQAKEKAKDIGEDIKNGASELYDKAKDGTLEGWSKIKGWYENKTGK